MKSFLRIIAFSIIFIICVELVIVLINNQIADGIKKELIRTQSIPEIQIIESISIAGKIFGNGNGIQYTGAILVKSTISQNRIKEYYTSFFPECIVLSLKQSQLAKYFHFSQATDSVYYIISITRDVESGLLQDSIIYELLSMDYRAH